ncbi:TetR family transcriptional regulator [Nonomuraea roseoviolacea subsp. roseoviolacea]|uniref:AcrR family transcriptional regulator n=1 Tax=Nonomuraea roseoviolacea subsp. carminata TaxID=160689 RepID=A0ABT1JVS3_9ACTN|nr:TetR family transcriptional regulator [Nonomuraea roseoviolacea]MCP2345351.1 AcrR family transcriptional regulator [Nonomuraea roseoviolacea subsp. carminata]
MGLRERKKEKTRLAILDAALDLFLEQGYDSTTVEQIAGSVDISPRTFFRYFSSKDSLVMWFHDHGEEIITETLRSRPPGEPPFTSMVHGMRAVLGDMQDSTPQDAERFLKLRRVLDDQPRLVGLSVARGAETERRLAAEVAARRGADPADDRVSHLVVAIAMAAVRVGFECPRKDQPDLREVVEQMQETITLVEGMMRPGWDVQDAREPADPREAPDA